MKFKKNKLYFIPLGGAGEIGMNLNVFGYNDQWIIIDMGVSFGDEVFSSIDVVMPDPKFLLQVKDKICGLILTHGHEDHVGAIPYLWPLLKCQMYATPFTAKIIEKKLEQEGINPGKKLELVDAKSNFKVGPFEIEYVQLTHSIPEPNGILLKTPVGNIFHTGDWKFDDDPIVGHKADIKKLKEIGKQEVLALIGDSTNALCPGRSESESVLFDQIYAIVKERKQAVIIASFASNVARLKTIAEVAKQTGRKVILMGRSLDRIYGIARECGYLEEYEPFLSRYECKSVPRSKRLVISTGSQGEPRAALNRATQGLHSQFEILPQDTVIFSSRVIPGNEKVIYRLQNQLLKNNVEVITAKDDLIHVSGHPFRDELIEMYSYIKPHYSVPVHGEWRHMSEHGKIAEASSGAKPLIGENGSVFEFDGKTASILEETVFTGRLVLDRKRLLPRDDDIIRTRRRISYEGICIFFICLDQMGELITTPRLCAPGVFDSEKDLDQIEIIESEIAEVIESIPSGQKQNLIHVEECIRRAAKAIFAGYGLEKQFTKIEFSIIDSE